MQAPKDPSKALQSILSTVKPSSKKFSLFGEDSASKAEPEKVSLFGSGKPGSIFGYKDDQAKSKSLFGDAGAFKFGPSIFGSSSDQKKTQEKKIEFKPSGGKIQFKPMHQKEAAIKVIHDGNVNSELAAAQAEPTNITFKPLVSLEIKSGHDNGQTDDSVPFEEVSKIFHFDSERKIWIDYGKVKMQISINNTTGRAKTVARDEITGKLRMCGGIHPLANMELKKTKGCAWSMKDFTGTWSEDGKDVYVSAKFKSTEIRDRFVESYAAAVGGEKQNPAPIPENPPAQKEEDPAEVDLSWLPRTARGGKTLWEKTVGVNEFSDKSWSAPTVCKMKVCESQPSSSASEEPRAWVEIWDEHTKKLIYLFALQEGQVVKWENDTLVFSFNNMVAPAEGEVVTVSAIFNSQNDAQQCNKIFDLLCTSKIDFKALQSAAGIESESEQPAVKPFQMGTSKKPLFDVAPGKPEANALPGPSTTTISFTGSDNSKQSAEPFKFSFGSGDSQKPSGFAAFLNDKSESKGIFSGEAKTFSWGDQSSGGLGSAFNPLAPPKAKEADDAADKTRADGEDDFNGLDYTLKPIVTLEKQEVNSGDTEDEVLFEQRAKVYRLSAEDKQWKERGLGILKITLNKQANRYRVLQRDEVIGKLRVHHVVTGAICDKDGKPKFKIWSANDHTDDEPEIFSFCAKFKTPEGASEFEAAFVKADKYNSSQQ